MGRESHKKAATRKRPQAKVSEISESDASRVTPGKVVARLRGWVVAGYARVELRHVSEGGTSIVERWPLRVEGDACDTEALAGFIRERAQDEADTLKGRQVFAVLAYETVEPGTHYAARITFAVDANGETSDDVGPTEGATQEGITAMLARHVEVTQRTIATMYSEVVGVQARMIEKLYEKNERDEERRFQYAEAYEKVVGFQHERELAKLAEERKDRAIDRAFDMFGTYLPAVANRFLGSGKSKPVENVLAYKELSALLKLLSEAPPEKLFKIASAIGAENAAVLQEIKKSLETGKGDGDILQGMVRDLFARLSSEQIDRLSPFLTQEEGMLFVTIYREYAKEEQKRVPAAPPTPPTN